MSVTFRVWGGEHAWCEGYIYRERYLVRGYRNPDSSSANQDSVRTRSVGNVALHNAHSVNRRGSKLHINKASGTLLRTHRCFGGHIRVVAAFLLVAARVHHLHLRVLLRHELAKSLLQGKPAMVTPKDHRSKLAWGRRTRTG